MRHYWKTEKEETEEGFSSPVHAVALRKGNVFMFFPLCHDSLEPKNPSKIAAILGNIRKAADGMKLGQRCIYCEKIVHILPKPINYDIFSN